MSVEISVDNEEIDCIRLKGLVKLLHSGTTLRDLDVDDFFKIFPRVKRLKEEYGMFATLRDILFLQEDERTLGEIYNNLCQKSSTEKALPKRKNKS